MNVLIGRQTRTACGGVSIHVKNKFSVNLFLVLEEKILRGFSMLNLIFDLDQFLLLWQILDRC